MNRFDFWSEEELEEIQNQNLYFDEVIAKKIKKIPAKNRNQTKHLTE